VGKLVKSIIDKLWGYFNEMRRFLHRKVSGFRCQVSGWTSNTERTNIEHRTSNIECWIGNCEEADLWSWNKRWYFAWWTI